MHYSEMADAIEEHLDWQALDQETGLAFVQLKNALRDGAGYVVITLDPEGLKIKPAYVPGSTQETIRAKQTLRRVAHQITISTGMPRSTRSRADRQG